MSFPTPVPIGATGLELVRLYRFFNLSQPAVIFKSVYKGDFSLNWQTKPMNYFFQEKYVFQKTKI